jgi:protein TonB
MGGVVMKGAGCIAVHGAAFAVTLVALLGSPSAAAQEQVIPLAPVEVTAPWPLIPPRYKEVPEPPYPEGARAREEEGAVALLVRVRPGGGVGEVKVQKSSGNPLLDEPAVKGAKVWTFIPARQGPTPVEVWVGCP